MRTREEQIIQAAQYLISTRKAGKSTEYDLVECIVDEAERRAEERVRAEIANQEEYRLSKHGNAYANAAREINND